MAGPEKTEIALHDKLNELQQKVAHMRELGSTAGFFQAYFRMLKDTQTAVEAFNAVNDAYFEYWGEYRYSCWKSFRGAKNEYIKKTKP